MSKQFKIWNKICYCFCSLFLYGIPLWGQQALSGKVIDTEKQGVFPANVYVKNNPTQGTTTTIEGLFDFTINEWIGKDTLVISCIGFETQYIDLDNINFNQILEVTLAVKTTHLDEITISSSTSLSKEFSIMELDRLSIYMTPVSNADPLKAITILPYSTNTSEGANPELRGSSAK